MSKKKTAMPKEDYTLPKFNKAKMFKHLDKLVEKAPGGVVQLVIDLFGDYIPLPTGLIHNS